MSDTEEFQPKPLTAKEQLRLNIMVTVTVVAILAMGGVILHYHTDPVSPYAASTPVATPDKPAPKI